MKTIDQATLVRRVAAGTILAAHVIGQADGWCVVVKDGSTTCTLTARRGSVRLFRRLEPLVEYLKGVGLDRFEVDASGYPSELPSRRRPNTSAPIKDGDDETAEHDRWFRNQVKNTLDRIERGEIRFVPDDEHRAGWRQKRVDLLARVKRGG
jgi:hypothetical protein